MFAMFRYMRIYHWPFLDEKYFNKFRDQAIQNSTYGDSSFGFRTREVLSDPSNGLLCLLQFAVISCFQPNSFDQDLTLGRLDCKKPLKRRDVKL